MKRIVLILLFLMLFPVSPGAAAPEVPPGSVLSLEDCLELAFEHHPDSSLGLAGVALQKPGRSGEIVLRPTLDLGVPFRTRAERTIRFGTLREALLTDGGKPVRPSRGLRTTSRRSGRTAPDMAGEGLRREGSLFQPSPFSRGRGRRRRDGGPLRNPVEAGQAFYKAGSSAKIEVTAAEVNLSQGRLELAKARSTASVSLASLENAVGTRLPDRNAVLAVPPEASVAIRLSRVRSAKPFRTALTVGRGRPAALGGRNAQGDSEGAESFPFRRGRVGIFRFILRLER